MLGATSISTLMFKKSENMFDPNAKGA